MEDPRTSSAAPIGLIAGAGRLPLEAVVRLREQGRPVAAIAFEGLSDPALATALSGDALRWMRLGALAAMRDALAELGVRRLLLVGAVPKSLLLDGRGLVAPDAEAVGLLARLVDRGDEPLLRGLADWLVGAGFEVLSQEVWLAPLLAPVGAIAGRTPSSEECADAVFGGGIVRALGRAGVGQSVVVKQGCVLAVEAIEGTDETIRRGGALGGAGVTVVKGARPGQDRRFDLPAVGPGTLRAMQAVGARALAIEAGAALILERAEFRAIAERSEIAVWGLSLDEAACEGSP
ncbi:MAG: UDP-2,3-diacylglucosamine diphosphatase LpxI [Spirochaetaceae bacterium]|nr:UDP-2,3-diacylglucosamine diphosphatase LpxI [Myxococcales bacterium]MCB9723492.1 UDP-2,3-diacylglucosamine diphosphatase LpxI [Spirochaetaceae bacterium]HPG26577.1 UDP-2,3-diacylglucosamine diphosphatase LpxI [Myxococcota bacterium]